MFNANPNPSSEVGEQYKFVKVGDTLTVTFDSDKKLLDDEIIVRINGVNMTTITETENTSTPEDDSTYTCTMVVPNSFEEGKLQLFIGNIMSYNHKLSTKSYNNNDLIDYQDSEITGNDAAVTFDKTSPIIEYIPKPTN